MRGSYRVAIRLRFVGSMSMMVESTNLSEVVNLMTSTRGQYLTSTESWRSYLVSEAEKNGWLFIDLIGDFNQLEKASIAGIFDGHYSVEGNRYVAERIYQHLMNAQEVASLLND